MHNPGSSVNQQYREVGKLDHALGNASEQDPAYASFPQLSHNNEISTPAGCLITGYYLIDLWFHQLPGCQFYQRICFV